MRLWTRLVHRRSAFTKPTAHSFPIQLLPKEGQNHICKFLRVALGHHVAARGVLHEERLAGVLRARNRHGQWAPPYSPRSRVKG